MSKKEYIVWNNTKQQFTCDPSFWACGTDGNWAMIVEHNSYPIRDTLNQRGYRFYPSYIGGDEDCPEYHSAWWKKSFPSEADLIAEMEWVKAFKYVMRDTRRVSQLIVV